MRRIVARTLFRRPTQVVSGSVTSAGATAIFPTTEGKVNIGLINYGTDSTDITSTPAVINLQKPGGSPIYMTLVATQFKGSPSIPGFILPAGGLEAVSNSAVPVTFNIYYD